MAIAVALGVAFAAVLIAGLAWYAVGVDEGWQVALFVVVLAAAGYVTSREAADRMRYWAKVDPGAHPGGATREDAVPLVEGHLARLAALADLPAPRADVFWADAPLCWTTVGLTGRPRVHVATGLVNRLSDDQLGAVLAHELTHVVNGDARIMTFVAGPATWILASLRDMWRQGGRVALAAVVVGLFMAPLVLPAALTGRVVSRHRELTADRGAALLTGSPVAIASALLALSGRLDQIPKRDLRAAGAGDLFYILPTREAYGIGRLWATHPPLGRRVAQLERMEQTLQRARPVL
ncbi:MAG: M48 family metalloprotease [Actinomycetota bacterium]|nr:M48 family metalloprotease [Actinomycetota bacterium]